MKSRPILFNSEMVRAVLDGRKTQTRRVIKPQPEGELVPLDRWSRSIAGTCGCRNPGPGELKDHSHRLKGKVFPFDDGRGYGLSSPQCPYGKPGDELWVRETHQISEVGGSFSEYFVTYPADDSQLIFDERDVYRQYPNKAARYSKKTRPSIHMPQWASRIALTITDVRVERVQDITEDDVNSEGVYSEDSDYGGLCQNIIDSGYSNDVERGSSDVACFKKLWDSINDKRGYGWDKNLWVWVVEFEVKS